MSKHLFVVFTNFHSCQFNKAKRMRRKYFLCHHFILMLFLLSLIFSPRRCRLAARLESLITDQLCFSHPCSAVFIFYFELLWPSEPHRRLCSPHHPFSKSSLSLSFHSPTPSLWPPRAELSWSLSSSCPCSQGVDRNGLQLFHWYTVL